MSNKILSIQKGSKILHFEYFDTDKEIEVWIEDQISYRNISTYISVGNANSIINHLVSQLQKVGEPVEILQR